MKTTYIAAGIVIGILAVAIAGITFSENEQAEGQMGMMNQGSMGSGMMSTATSNSWQQNQGSFSATAGSIVDNVSVTGVAVTGDDEVTVSLRYTGTDDPDGVVVIASTNPTMLMSRMHSGNSGMMGMSGMMGGMQGMGGMMGGNMMGSGAAYQAAANPMWYNNTDWQAWHEQMAQWHGQLDASQWQQMQELHNQLVAQGTMGPGIMMPGMSNSTAIPYSAFQSQTGSSAIDAGWTDGNYKIKLEGDGSAYDSGQFMVMVFPLTS